jgi:hypothetical protein
MPTRNLLLTDTATSKTIAQPAYRVFSFAIAALLAAGVLAYFLLSCRWPLVHDAQVLHYVTLLIAHGRAPYREIYDMNMPGAYLTEMAALRLFGHSDLGWRLWDFTLTLVMTGAMIAIARRYHWTAGLIAASVFALIHGADRAYAAAQRDQVIAVLLIAGWAICFESVRLRLPWLMLVALFLTTFAGTIKPTVLPAGLCLLLLALFELHRRSANFRPYIVCGVLGFIAALALSAGFLLLHHSTRAFLFDLTQVLPNYVTMAPAGRRQLLLLTFPWPIWITMIAAAILAAHSRLWRNWEQPALLLGLFFGFLSYYLQRRGFPQHRYELLAFALLWAAIQFELVLRSPRLLPRTAAALALVFLCVTTLPLLATRIAGQPTHDPLTQTLQADLNRLGPARLQNNVLCLDIISGCMTALFHLDIVQSVGTTGDLLLFFPQNSPVTDSARTLVWQNLQQHPPSVIILTNARFVELPSFRKLQAWPAFADYLSANYVPVVQRNLPFEGAPPFKDGIETCGDRECPGYRIYIRRNSPLLASFER